MPTYDYYCEANQRQVEVSHRMSETLSTWGELCERAGLEPGETPAESPVKRLATGGNLVLNSPRSGNDLPPCASGGSCPGGSCEFG